MQRMADPGSIAVAGALLALLEGARKNGWGNEPQVRKMKALQAAYDKSDKRTQGAKQMAKKILELKEGMGIGTKMFEYATGDAYGALMKMLDD